MFPPVFGNLHFVHNEIRKSFHDAFPWILWFFWVSCIQYCSSKLQELTRAWREGIKKTSSDVVHNDCGLRDQSPRHRLLIPHPSLRCGVKASSPVPILISSEIAIRYKNQFIRKKKPCFRFEGWPESPLLLAQGIPSIFTSTKRRYLDGFMTTTGAECQQSHRLGAANF